MTIVIIVYFIYLQNESFNTNLNLKNPLINFFYNNYPTLFCVADKRQGTQLINLVNPQSLSNIMQNTTIENRSNISIPYAHGNRISKILFLDALPKTYTLIGITKYNGALKGRILTNKFNSIFGHYAGKAGVTFVDKWVTNPNNPILSDPLKPLVTCVRATNNGVNGATKRINDVILNNIPIGGYNNNYPKTIDRSELSINNTAEPSDFSFSLVCVFPIFLSDNDILFVSNLFNQILIKPELLTDVENIIKQIVPTKNTENTYNPRDKIDFNNKLASNNVAIYEKLASKKITIKASLEAHASKNKVKKNASTLMASTNASLYAASNSAFINDTPVETTIYDASTNAALIDASTNYASVNSNSTI